MNFLFKYVDPKIGEQSEIAFCRLPIDFKVSNYSLLIILPIKNHAKLKSLSPYLPFLFYCENFSISCDCLLELPYIHQSISYQIPRRKHGTEGSSSQVQGKAYNLFLFPLLFTTYILFHQPFILQFLVNQIIQTIGSMSSG